MNATISALRIFFVSQFLALTGDRAASLVYATFAERYAVMGLGGLTSLLAAVQITPILLLSVYGGQLADRYSKKWLMWWADLGRVVVVMFFWGLSIMGWDNAAILLTAVFMLGGLTAVFNPAKKSLLPFLVPRDQLQRQSALFSISEISAMIVGLAWGTWLLTVASAQTALLANFLVFATALALLTMMRMPTVANDPASLGKMSGRSPVDGWRFTFANLWNTPSMRNTLLLATVPFYTSAGLFFAGLSAVAAGQSSDNAGRVLGGLLLALAAGALIGAGMQRWAPYLRRSEGQQLGVVSLACAVGMVVATRCLADLVWLHLAVFFTGLFVGLIYVRTVWLWQRYAPPAILGRALGVAEAISALCFATCAGFGGWATSTLEIGTIWLLAAAVLACSGWISFRKFVS